MAEPTILWIASFPRSGNTDARTILFHCFGLKSTSIHPGEFRTNPESAHYAGHIERSDDGVVEFGDQAIRPIKTHGRPQGSGKAIYVIRDGREAIRSLSVFYGNQPPLAKIIGGQHVFGTWAGHLGVWEPLTRPDTLLLRYEDLVADQQGVIGRMAEFLAIEPRSYVVPAREELADGRYVRPAGASKPEFSPEDLELFWQINGDAMRTYGYAERAPELAR